MEELPEIVILGATIGSRRDRENEQEEVELNAEKEISRWEIKPIGRTS